MAQLIRKCVRSCEQCIKASRIKNRLTYLTKNPTNISQDRKTPCKLTCLHAVAIKTMLRQYMCSQDICLPTLTLKQFANTVAPVIFNILTDHAYLPTTIISDVGSAFVSHVSKEVADVVGFTLVHGTTKHAQTIGRVERTRASLKKAIKNGTGERRSM